MKNLRLFTLFFCILAFTACDSVDFGGVNTDDDNPQEASTEGLMAGAMNRYFSSLTGRSYHTNPTLYVQYQTQSTYTTEMTYGQNPYPWSDYYSGTLSNLSQVYETTTADEVPAIVETFGSANNQAAVAEIMSAVIWKRVTDTWGPVPYNEALNADENKTPAYTSQDSIYTDLISRVKAARDMITIGDGPTGDVLYGGDMEKWQKFANSFLLSLSIQLSEADEALAEQEFNAALNHEAGVIENVADEAWYDHQNTSGATNPFTASRGSDYFLAEPFTDALKAETPNDSSIVYSNDSMVDERINVLSTDPEASGGKFGIDKIVQPSGTASISSNIWDPEGDLPHMTAAYTYLNRAEAAERGWTNEVAADMLVEGITASYATLDAHYDDGSASSGALQSDGTDFAAQRVLDAATAEDGILQVIGEEKWVALFPMGFDAWSEWRRTSHMKDWGNGATGYPGLYPAPDATNGGEIPRRYIYPSVEGGVNSANYEAGVGMLSPAEDDNVSRFWWDKE